jgi:nitrate reductase gamma subunit
MTGAWVLQILVYLAVLVFAVVVVRRLSWYARAPMHLRWELYPVPHEVGKEYGGSYLEELDWWEKPRPTSLIGELKVMIPEMTFLVALWHHNRKVWLASFPFHFGIYLSIAFIALLVVDGIAQALGAKVAVGADTVGVTLYYLTVVAGVAGMIAVTIGSLGLLGMRLFNDNYRRYSTPADFFNLLFILGIALSGLYSWLFVDPAFNQARSYAQGLVTLDPPTAIHGALLVQVVLLALFMIYMPFTHMAHFLGKYVTYHAVRWDDAPNTKDSSYAKELDIHLRRPIGWSAPHMGTGRTWVEVATKGVED